MVIKRFSTLLGSKRGVNPFSRSNSSDAAAIEEEPTVAHAEDTPEGSVLRGVVCLLGSRSFRLEMTDDCLESFL